MKVKDWIEWLSKQPPENEVMLRDPHTEWYLPLRTTPFFNDWDAMPADWTPVFAEYNDPEKDTN